MVPSNRSSLGAFSISTATRSATTLRAIERGTFQLAAGDSTRLRHTRGVSSSPAPVIRIATRSTLITWKVSSTTRSSRKSTSVCCESSLAISSRRESLRPWRSAAETPPMRSSDSGWESESRAAMSAGPCRRTCRRIVASSEPSPGVAVGALSSHTSKSTLPKETRAPGIATASLTRSPLRKVPLVEPRSRTRTPRRRQLQLGVLARHRRILNGEIAGHCPAYGIRARARQVDDGATGDGDDLQGQAKPLPE